MKKVTLIVPDKIDHVIGSSMGGESEPEDVNATNIKRALCDRDEYHQYYYFESSEKVKVFSIVDYEGRD